MFDRSRTSALLIFALAGCGPADPASDPATTPAEESEIDQPISQRTPAFVRLRRDMRRCISPLCGGYYATDLNRTAEVYVSGLDFSASGLSDADLELAQGTEGAVIFGRLSAAEPRFNTRALIVERVFLPLPGFTARTTDRFYTVMANDPPIQCITAPCNNVRARLANTGRSWSSFTGLDLRTVLVPFADEAWIDAQIQGGHAVVAAHFEDGDRLPGGRERLLVVSQAFLELGQPAPSCPLARPINCGEGFTFAWARDENRCVVPVGCVQIMACPAFVPACAEGYVQSSWTGTNACTNWACDPAFAPPPAFVEAPPSRCMHVRCAPGYHCVDEGEDACVPNVTCANVRCGSDTYCDDSAGEATCREYTWTPEAVSVASASPYANNVQQRWRFTSEVAGSTAVRLSFSRFDTERGYDFVIVEDAAGAELARYSGALGAFVSDPLPGHELVIRFVTDGSVTRPGFAIDRVDVRTP